MNDDGLSIVNTKCELILIGLRGSGKSTVGRALALHRHCVFVDLDELVIAEFAETTVRDIWDRHGEEAWRRAEERLAVATLTHWQADMVLALGGGTVMIESVRECLSFPQRGDIAKVVYLRGEPMILLERLTADDGDRPCLTDNEDLADEMTVVFRERDSVYCELADIVIEIQAEAVKKTVERIMTGLAEYRSSDNDEEE